MADKPILFSAAMIRALLDGAKSQTRRVLKPQPDTTSDPSGHGAWGARNKHDYWCPAEELRPHDPGDRLWVKETWATHSCATGVHAKGDGHPWGSPIYRATFGAALDPKCEGFSPWRSSRFMPRWASRLTLIVNDVRVQRVQEITLEDVYAEGIFTPIDNTIGPGARAAADKAAFRDLWDSINAKRGYGWDANPWVSALTFTVIKANIDSPAAQPAAALRAHQSLLEKES